MRWRQYEGFQSYQYCTCRHTKPFGDMAQTRYREHSLSRILLWPVTGLFLPIYRFVTWKQVRRGKWTRFRIAAFTNNFPSQSHLHSKKAGHTCIVQPSQPSEKCPFLKLRVSECLTYPSRTGSVNEVVRWGDSEVTRLSFEMKFSSNYMKRFKKARVTLKGNYRRLACWQF